MSLAAPLPQQLQEGTTLEMSGQFADLITDPFMPMDYSKLLSAYGLWEEARASRVIPFKLFPKLAPSHVGEPVP